jgi:transcription elongation factor Elf1
MSKAPDKIKWSDWGKAEVLWKCPTCEHLDATVKNPAMGFDGQAGALICKRCGERMNRKELKKSL